MNMTAKTSLLLAFSFLTAGSLGYALPALKMPQVMQTTNMDPQLRSISLKLPLRQVKFHWTFMSREEFLAGRLVLRIMRSDQTNAIIIFEQGRISDGWEAISLPNPKAGEIYFGFKSTRPYQTAPGDRLELELQVKQDLSGIGPEEKGILPAGIYQAHGAYSGLLDEFKVPAQLKDAPAETLNKLRQDYDHAAFLENWQDQWDLRITGQEGWLAPKPQRQIKQPPEKKLENAGPAEK